GRRPTMTDTLAKLFRTVFVAFVAVIGMIMAAILLVSTAVALGIVYIVARLRGKPFTANTVWQRSQARWGFGSSGSDTAASTPATGSRSSFASRLKKHDIVDVEVRDVP